MDWGRLERDMKNQTATILQSKGRHVIPYAQPQQLPHRGFESGARTERGYDRRNGSYDDHKEDMYNDDRKNDEIWNELQEMKNVIMKQNEKMRRLEDLLDSKDASNIKFNTIYERFEQVESDIQSCTKLITSMARENTDFIVQSKTMNGRLHWVEDMVRTSSQDFISKSSFSQFLDTSSDQLKNIHNSAETARSNSTICITFIESLLAAFSQLQGNQHTLGLEHLANLSGERQRGQISQHLKEALHGAISREVEIGCVGVHTRVGNITSEIRKDVSSAMNEIKEQIVQHGQAMADEVVRASESTNKQILDSSKQLDRTKQRLEAEISALKESLQVLEIDHSDLRQEVNKSIEATAKMVSITLPTAQRNHKSLLDEVMRLEELTGDLINRMQKTEADTKHIQLVQKQVLDWQDKKDSLLAKSDRETAIAPIRAVPPPIPPIPLQTVQVSVPPLAEIAACKKCAALEERVSHLETKAAIGDDSMERLITSTKSLESGMDALQAEFAVLYDDADKKKSALADQANTVAAMKSDLVELKVKLSNIPLEVFPKTAIQVSDGGARAGLTGATDRIKHSSIATAHSTVAKPQPLQSSGSIGTSSNPSTTGGTGLGSSVTSIDSHTHKASSDAMNIDNAKRSSGISSVSSLPPIHSPDSSHSHRHVSAKPPPPEILALLEQAPSSFDENDDDSYVISDSDEDRDMSRSSQHKIVAGKVGAVSVVTATVSSRCDVSSDSSFEKSGLDESDVKDFDEGDTEADKLGAYPTDARKDIASDLKVEFNDEDMLDVDDGSSVDSETGEGKGPLDMRETSRIEDSLDESINTFDEEHKMLVRSPSQNDIVIPPPRNARKVVKIANTSKYEQHKSTDKRIGDSGENVSSKHPDDDKPETKPHASTNVDAPGPKFVVDSLGNIVSSRSKSFGIVGPVEPMAEAVSKERGTVSVLSSDDSSTKKEPAHQALEDTGGRMKGPSTAILSSGSLLGSKGRNKSPLLSSASLPISSGAPPAVPLPTGAKHEETAQCTFCLRRMNIEDMRAHMKVCELRTELCQFGCRSRIMVSKMDKHVAICPNNPENKDFT